MNDSDDDGSIAGNNNWLHCSVDMKASETSLCTEPRRWIVINRPQYGHECCTAVGFRVLHIVHWIRMRKRSCGHDFKQLVARDAAAPTRHRIGFGLRRVWCLRVTFVAMTMKLDLGGGDGERLKKISSIYIYAMLPIEYHLWLTAGAVVEIPSNLVWSIAGCFLSFMLLRLVVSNVGWMVLVILRWSILVISPPQKKAPVVWLFWAARKYCGQ